MPSNCLLPLLVTLLAFQVHIVITVILLFGLMTCGFDACREDFRKTYKEEHPDSKGVKEVPFLPLCSTSLTIDDSNKF